MNNSANCSAPSSNVLGNVRLSVSFMLIGATCTSSAGAPAGDHPPLSGGWCRQRRLDTAPPTTDRAASVCAHNSQPARHVGNRAAYAGSAPWYRQMTGCRLFCASGECRRTMLHADLAGHALGRCWQRHDQAQHRVRNVRDHLNCRRGTYALAARPSSGTMTEPFIAAPFCTW
jgi:hypothetical protein